MITLINDARLAIGKGPLGFLNHLVRSHTPHTHPIVFDLLIDLQPHLRTRLQRHHCRWESWLWHARLPVVSALLF